MKFIGDSNVLKTFVDDMKMGNLKINQSRNIFNAKDDALYKSFKDPTKKRLFEENNRNFNNFMRTNFYNFTDLDDKSNYEEKFKILREYCNQNSKYFSKIKHFSGDLAKKMIECSDLMDKINYFFNKFIQINKSTMARL